jgi:hypothetical protein
LKVLIHAFCDVWNTMSGENGTAITEFSNGFLFPMLSAFPVIHDSAGTDSATADASTGQFLLCPRSDPLENVRRRLQKLTNPAANSVTPISGVSPASRTSTSQLQRSFSEASPVSRLVRPATAALGAQLLRLRPWLFRWSRRGRRVGARSATHRPRP